MLCTFRGSNQCSQTLPTDAAGELDVLGHDRHTLGVDCAQVGVLEEPHEVSLRRLLQRQDGLRLKAQVGLEVLRDLSHKPLERELADEQLGGLLVLAEQGSRRWRRACAGVM